MSLGDAVEGRLFEIDASISMQIIDVHVGHEVLNEQYEEYVGRRGKVWRRSVLVGVHVGYQFSNRSAFKFRGDIGGFGIGDAAQFT